MIKNQPISVQRLFDLRVNLGDEIDKIEDRSDRSFFQNLLDTLLLDRSLNYEDIQKRGIYRALILGSNNLPEIDKFVGASTFALLSNQNCHLTSIVRTFKEQSLRIDFIQESNLSQEKKETLVNVFRQKSPETDVQRHLNLSQIPSLVIKKIDLSLLHGFDDDINLLLSTDLVKKITLNIYFSSDSSNAKIFPLLRSIDIIPRGYDLESLNIINISENFNKSDLYNFIILNDKNDFLIQTFLNLLSDYENNFRIQGALPRKILESIFYTCDNNILSKTRLFQDKPEYQERMEGIILNENIDSRHKHRSLLMVLSYLQCFCLKSSVAPPKITDKTQKKVAWYIRSIWNMRGIFLEDDDLQRVQPSILRKRVFKEVKSLWHEASNASNTQDILFEVSKKLSSEILSTVVDLEIEKQDSSD
jgi:hypothetical protein